MGALPIALGAAAVPIVWSSLQSLAGRLKRRGQKRRETTQEKAIGEDEASSLVEALIRDKPKGVLLEWRDICVTVADGKKGEKELLRSVSGKATPGRLLAIMGPSGSGKTTLLSVLGGQLARSKKTALTGQLLADGKPAATVDGNGGGTDLAFVPQESVFYSELSVRETLETAAHLRLGPTIPADAVAAHVDDLLRTLGLTKVADTRVGSERKRGISGGERKRLSIGVELLGSPSLVLCDEPTTGLDSKGAEQVVNSLRTLADEGRTVIITIHQPRGSIWEQFDDLLLLSEGEVVYAGPTADSVAYFEKFGHKFPVHENPADFCVDLISLDPSSPEALLESSSRVEPLVAAWREKVRTEYQNSGGAGEGGDKIMQGERQLRLMPRRLRPLAQFRQLLLRSWRQVTRDKAAIISRLGSSVSSAVIFGCIFFKLGMTQTAIQSRLGLLQVATIGTAMTALMKTLATFPNERVVVDRERTKRSYGMLPYFTAKLAAELPVSVLFPMVFSGIVYPLCGLNRRLSRFLRFLGIVTVESFTSAALGLTVGAFAPNADVAIAIGPAIMVVFIVFGGYYVCEDDVPRILRWLPYTSLIKSAFEALCVNEFAGAKFEASQEGDASTGEQVLRRLTFGDSTVKGALSNEMRVLAFYYLAAYIVLRLKRPVFQAFANAAGGGSQTAPQETVVVAAVENGSAEGEGGEGSKEAAASVENGVATS